METTNDFDNELDDHPNYTRNVLLDILETFRSTARFEHFRQFLTSHMRWISALQSDTDLYNPDNREQLTILKNFLKYPEDNLQHFIELFQEYMDIKRSFRRYDNTDDDMHCLDTFFGDIVTELEYILERMPPVDYETMKENNRQFYHDLNKYVLKPQRIEKMAHNYGIEFIDYLDAIFGMDE